MKKRMDTTSAFSLIELLVVMAIILTLLGILLPSLQGVRQRAYTTVCVSNLRQIGIAITNYLADNDGFFPLARGCWHGGTNQRD